MGEQSGRGERQGSGQASADESFGACLGRLLEDRGWAVPELAEQLSVEPSLVYRWRRNERTPQLHTPYVARIAQILELTAAERAALEASQVYSLRTPRAPAARAHGTHNDLHHMLRNTPIEDAPTTLLDHLEQGGVESSEAETHLLGGPRTALPTYGTHGVIRGRADILEQTLALIDRAPAPSDPQANTILISTFAQAHWTQADVYYRTWQEALRRACARGWHVCHVWRLTKDVRRSIGVVRMVLDLVGTGQYTVLHLPSYETLRPAYDLLVIPGVGAIEYLGVEDGTGLDGALVLREPEQVELLRAHFAQIVAQAQPLLKVFFGEEEPAFAQIIADTYEQSGGRVLVKDGLSFVTEPATWLREDSAWAARSGQRGAALATQIEQRKRLLAAFEHYARTMTYRDVCPIRAVQELAETGHYLATGTAAARPAPAMSREERSEHLENTIAVLDRHARYELALVDALEEAETAVLPGRFWEVVGNMRVFTNLRVPDANRRPVNAGVMIFEATVVGAFQQFFEDLWARISPRNKDKQYVRWWLTRQLEHLQES